MILLSTPLFSHWKIPLKCEDQIYILTTSPAFTCFHSTINMVKWLVVTLGKGDVVAEVTSLERMAVCTQLTLSI
jgi:hypothetical protein